MLTFLNFPTELGALPCLNASVRFGYAESPYLSCLSTLSTGYSRLADGAYEELSVPPMRWGFSAFNPPRARFAPLRVLGATGLPYRRPAPTSPWTCKAPACPASCKATASSRATTSRWAMAAGAPMAPARFPDSGNLADPALALVDLDSNGQLELLVSAGSATGFYRHGDDGG